MGKRSRNWLISKVGFRVSMGFFDGTKFDYINKSVVEIIKKPSDDIHIGYLKKCPLNGRFDNFDSFEVLFKK